MSSICWRSTFPGRRGLHFSSSPNMQPTDLGIGLVLSTIGWAIMLTNHISTAVVYVEAPKSNSGARYHNVTTLGVIGFSGVPNLRASPKSAMPKSDS